MKNIFFKFLNFQLLIPLPSFILCNHNQYVINNFEEMLTCVTIWNVRKIVIHDTS